MSDELLTLLPFTLVVLLALAVILVDLFWPRRDDLIMACLLYTSPSPRDED